MRTHKTSLALPPYALPLLPRLRCPSYLPNISALRYSHTGRLNTFILSDRTICNLVTRLLLVSYVCFALRLLPPQWRCIV